jgi:hypothetical protein
MQALSSIFSAGVLGTQNLYAKNLYQPNELGANFID